MSVLTRLAGSFWRATLTGFDAARKMAVVQVKGLGGTTRSEIEYAEPYGFISSPPPGADVEVFGVNVGASADHAVALCVSDRSSRIATLLPGEVGVQHSGGHGMLLSAAGIFIGGPGAGVPVNIGGTTEVGGTGIFTATTSVGAPTITFTTLSGGGGISGSAGMLSAPTIKATANYKSADGSNGATGSFVIPGPLTVTYKNGLITGVA